MFATLYILSMGSTVLPLASREGALTEGVYMATARRG